MVCGSVYRKFEVKEMLYVCGDWVVVVLLLCVLYNIMTSGRHARCRPFVRWCVKRRKLEVVGGGLEGGCHYEVKTAEGINDAVLIT